MAIVDERAEGTNGSDPARDAGTDEVGVRRRATVALRWLLTRGVVGLAISLVIAVAALYLAQDLFVYGAEADVADIATGLPGADEVRYTTSDGVELRGWFLAGAAPSTGTTAVVFHGSHSTRSSMASYAAGLARGGVSVLLAEYRGFGGIDGRPTEDGLGLDAAAAIDYVRARPDVDDERLVYVGFSLGTGVAVAAASQAPPAALVLLAPYTSIPDVAWSRLPGIPYGILMRTTFDSIDRIGGIHRLLLVVRGSRDTTVPTEQSGLVFDAAPGPKQLVTIDGADHGLVGPTGPSIEAATLAFLEGLGLG